MSGSVSTTSSHAPAKQGYNCTPCIAVREVAAVERFGHTWEYFAELSDPPRTLQFACKVYLRGFMLLGRLINLEGF
jgi:hypothetical protein